MLVFSGVLKRRVKIVLGLWKRDKKALLQLIRYKILSLFIDPRAKSEQELTNKYIRNSLFFTSNSLKVFKGTNFDICIANDNLTLNAAYKVAHSTGAKLIYDAIECPPLNSRAGNAFHYFERDLLEVIKIDEKFFIDQCAGLITIGPSMLEWIKGHYHTEKTEVIRNCRNYEDMPDNKKIRKDCRLSANDRLVLMINGVYPGQGAEVLIEALQHLDSQTHIATLGPVTSKYKEQLQSIAIEKGVNDRFHILKPKPWREMLDYASGADMGIIPRQADSLNNRLSLPNRIFELVMARLPVATADIKDIKDIVESYAIGTAFDETNAESLAQCINFVLSDDKYKTYKKNIDIAAQDLCWENEKEKLLKLIKDVCPEKESLSICLLTRKDISKNNRIARISRALSEAGHKMHIGAPTDPGKIQYDDLAKYYIVPFNAPLIE